jgi:alpha-mannosidase
MSKLKTTVLLLIFMISIFQAKTQNNDKKAIYNLAAKSKNWFEGFQKNVGANEFSYHSFRSDVGKALITRCTDGKMAIEWQTQTVPVNFDKEEAGFLWIAALDLTPQTFVFDVFVNGQKRFEINSSNQKEWQLKTADGGTLSFVNVEIDQAGDVHGYMSLVVPKSWLVKGESQILKIVGRENKDNTWIIVYQADDALAYLQKSIEYDVWMDMEIEKTKGGLQCRLKGPVTLAGTEVRYSFSGKTNTLQLSEVGEFAVGTFSLPLSSLKKPFTVSDAKGELFVIPLLGEDYKNTRMQNKAVLFNEGKKEGEKIKVNAVRTYEPKTVAGMFNLANSILSKGQIYLMNSSHQDIAWMDSPEKCVIERDTMLITPLLEMGAKDENYRFDLEDGLMLREYIERHPDKKALVKEMLNDGRISCGSSYIQPYEEMYSGESLARQFYLGAKWLKDEFGYKATVYWNEDVPGRTLQMSQLMSKAGTRYLMISRHERGIFNWYSPDGSFVTVFSPGHYGDAFGPLNKNFHEAGQYLAKSSMDWEKYYTNKTSAPVIPILSDNDMSPAKDYGKLIQNWGNIHELQGEKGNYMPVKLPGIRVATAPEFFEALMAQKPQLPSISGERPDVWLYIHGPSHQKAIKASREADILLPMAEKFATANALVDGSFRNYPEVRLGKAWAAKIYPDHGWGGKHGDITDALFLSKYEFSKAEAEKIVAENLDELASKVNTHPEKGRALVVFNGMNTKRNDPVSIEVSFKQSEAFGLELSDVAGSKIDVQLSKTDHYPDGTIKRCILHFLAKDVPSVGYSTCYLKALNKKSEVAVKPFSNEAENRFYKLKFADGGLSSIFDKELNKELIDPAKFKAGEVFTMRSFGNGAGEFIDIQKPDMEGFDKTGNYPTKWEIEENGPVFTTYKYRQHIRYAVIEQRVKVFHEQKRIDFEPSVLNWEGILYREFRMALPLNMTDGKVSYEVPFGVVEAGKDEMKGAAGERYTTVCKEMHPRGIENWISASNSAFGVTMSSSVAVADWIDPTDNPIANQMLQPILLASRKSCHWEGNDYLQTGNHTFSFSITSHQPGWINGAVFGRRANEQLMPVWADHRLSDASLPESISFFKTDQENVLISTIKKAEDSDEAIVRLIDLEGKDRQIKFESFEKINQAEHTSLIEETIKPMQVSGNSLQISLGHNAIETIKIKTLK